MHNRITKLYTCPDCNGTTDGHSCRCGWVKDRFKKTRKNVARCRYCNQPGEYRGLCKTHWELQAEQEYKKRTESYRVPGKNDIEIDVLTGKISAKEGLCKRQEEENNDEKA